MNRYFTKEDTKMANKYLKMCSTLLTIRETQIKPQGDTTILEGLKFKRDNTKHCQRCGKMWNSLTVLVGVYIGRTIIGKSLVVHTS